MGVNKAVAQKRRSQATRAALQQSRAERYEDHANLVPTAEQEASLLRAAKASCAAWNRALLHPGESAYLLHKRFKQKLLAELEAGDAADEIGLLGEVAHCAIRDATTKIFYKMAPQPRDPNALIQFRVGGRLAFFNEQGLHLGLREPIALIDHRIPLLDVGSPYIVGARVEWTMDGWQAQFLLRPDPGSTLALKALACSSH